MKHEQQLGRRKLSSSFNMNKVFPYFYLFPSVFLVGVLFIYSAVYTFILSFTKWDGINTPEFIGLSNYIRMFSDQIFIVSFTNTILWVVSTMIFPVGIGLLMAVGIQHLRFSTIYKNIFYLPFAFSLTVAGVIWVFLLSSDGLSAMFAAWGWNELASIRWLQTPPYHTFSMIGGYTWQSMGTNMVLFLVGLNAIPKEPLEAGMLDGASGWKLFRHVTLPLLKPITNVVVLMALVNSMKVFDSIWIMTQGGPYRSSETLAVSMYRESFVLFHFGYGSALSVVLTIFVLALSIGYLKSTLKDEG